MGRKDFVVYFIYHGKEETARCQYFVHTDNVPRVHCRIKIGDPYLAYNYIIEDDILKGLGFGSEPEMQPRYDLEKLIGEEIVKHKTITDIYGDIPFARIRPIHKRRRIFRSGQ